MAQTEGQQVRVAMGGPDLDDDEFISFAVDRNREDRKRAESAGESRQKIGEFLDETGMNGKALAWSRQILKTNDKGDDGQAKAMDIILSLEKALPIVKAHVSGQQGSMNFDEPDAEVVTHTEELPKPTYSNDWRPDGDDEADPEIADEADDFEAHLADVSGAAAE